MIQYFLPNFEKDTEYRLNQNETLFHTFYLFNESQSTIWIGWRILPDPDTEQIAFISTVIEIELQALKASFGIQNPALQESCASLCDSTGIEMHEVARTCQN